MGHHHHHHHHHGLLHLPSFGRREQELPKGCMAIRVGRDHQERFVVPVMYLNHPLFAGLLKEAEEEYGFDHDGAITIPCQVEYFRRVQDTIQRQSGGGHGHGHHGHFHLASCFGGLKA